MNPDDLIEQALRSKDPVEELRSLAQRLITQGQDQPTILALFEQTRQRLRRENREADEDAVMDVMDFITGWCSPHMKLFQKPS
jgi:hypothetical protein